MHESIYDGEIHFHKDFYLLQIVYLVFFFKFHYKFAKNVEKKIFIDLVFSRTVMLEMRFPKFSKAEKIFCKISEIIPHRKTFFQCLK